MPMLLELRDGELAFLRSLISAKVRFLVIGGYAVKCYWPARVVEDLDILLDRSAENAERAYGVIVATLGYRPKFESADLTRRSKKLTLPDSPVDMLTSAEGIEFVDAWSRRIEATQSNLAIPVMSLADLVDMKRHTAMDPSRGMKDLHDLEWLESLETSQPISSTRSLTDLVTRRQEHPCSG